jgi:hypothetical protein
MVETLDDYYANGTLRRIDEYIDITSSQVDAALPYQQKLRLNMKVRGTKLAESIRASRKRRLGNRDF